MNIFVDIMQYVVFILCRKCSYYYHCPIATTTHYCNVPSTRPLAQSIRKPQCWKTHVLEDGQVTILSFICRVMQRVSETGISAFFFILFWRIAQSSIILLTTDDWQHDQHGLWFIILVSISAKLQSARPKPPPFPSPTTLLCKSRNIPY